ncbi:hypothetical protein LINPERHAP2_LOCUS14780 [Linum perenne]
MKVQPLLVQVLMWIHLLTLKIMKKKAVKLKLVKRMMVQVRWKDLFDRSLTSCGSCRAYDSRVCQ